MRSMWEDSGRFWMMLLAGLALMGGMMPTQMALAQEPQPFTLSIPNQRATLSRSTGEVTLTVNITCSEETTLDFVFCSAQQNFGRTQAGAFGEEGGPIDCAAEEVTSITLTLEPDFGRLKGGPTSVGCSACTSDFDFFCDNVGNSVNLRQTQ